MAGLDLDLDLNPRVKFNIDLGLGGHKPQRQRAAWREPVKGEQEQTLTNQALNVGLSGMSAVGGALDKPGQAVRGVLAGKGIGSLKHLIPFSHAMGLTTDKDETSGRDLTDMAGITDKQDKGWGAWGAGLAADMATDPLSYLTTGPKHALTAVGQIAKKAGLTKGLSRAEHIARGYSGMVGVGLPFKNPSYTFGKGHVAESIARYMDRGASKLKFGNPISRAANSLFDKSVGEATDEITQRGWQKHGNPVVDAEKIATRSHAAGLLQHLDPMINAKQFPETAITNAATTLAEGVPTVSQFPVPLLAQVQGLAQQIGTRNDTILSQAKRAGVAVDDAGDQYANYVHRQSLKANDKSLQLAKRGSFYPVASGSSLQRDDVFRDIPGGRQRVNDWFKRFGGDKAKGNKAAMIAAVRQDLENDLLAHAGGHSMTPKIAEAWDGRPAVAGTPAIAAQAAINGQPAIAAVPAVARVVGKRGKAANIAARLRAGSDIYRPTAANPAGLDFYTPDLYANEVQRGAQASRTLAAAHAAVGTIADAARPFLNDGTMTPIADVLKKIGLKTSKADKVAGTPMQGALVRMHELLSQRYGMAPAKLNGSVKRIEKQISAYGLTNEHAEQILRGHNKWIAPSPLKGPLDALKGATNAFKGLSYPIWLPSHVRNAGTATLNNIRSGANGIDASAAKALMEGTIDPDTLKRYGFGSVDDARKQAFVHAGIFGGHGITDDVSDNALAALTSPTPGRFTPHAPGTGRENFMQEMITGIPKGWAQTVPAIASTAKNLALDPLAMAPWNWGSGRVSQAINPIAIKGVGGATKDMLPAVKAGRLVGSHVEDLARLSQFLGEIRQGSQLGAAGEAVNRMHFDYDDLTGFEKNVMRTLVPFYTYARKNLPLQASTALHTPAWTQAQIKPFNQPNEDKGYVPDYLQSGVSIPTGPEKDGTRQYISKLGLPAEEAFERLHFKNGLPDVKRTALDYMGQMNPLIKGPLEQLFDTQFHTQRKLSDLHAPAAATAIGHLFGENNPQLLSQVLANSPATRFITSADKLVDSRKGWLPKAVNLLTGVRVSDVDVEKQRAIDSRTAVENLMRGHENIREHHNFYVPPEKGANLTPEEIELMRLYSTLQDNSAAYAKQQRIGVQTK